MMDWSALLTDIGLVSLPALWAPVLVWTAAALPLYVGLRFLRRAHVLVHYHGSLALLLALPASLALTPLTPPWPLPPSLYRIPRHGPPT